MLKGTKSLSDNNDMIYHRPLANAKDHSFDSGKRFKKKPKNRKPIHGMTIEYVCDVCCFTTSEIIGIDGLTVASGDEYVRRSALSIRVCLKEFCIEFIKSCYNPLMRAVKVR